MGKIAFIFSGQGAQFSGMGQELYVTSPEAADIFRRADAIRPGTSELCFAGTEEELAITKNTQPCIFTMGLAAAAAMTKAGIKPYAVAGLSLGEFSALTYSGVLPFEDCFRLVCLRGELMQADAEKSESTMAAIMRLDSETVEQLCSEYDNVYPVNYNYPGQISVSGPSDELEALGKAVKAAGGRVVKLKVRGGFHSPFMKTASEKFRAALAEIQFDKTEMVLYSNYTGLPYGDDCAELLYRQMCSPVRWQDIVLHMRESGIDTFIELGPKKTLCSFIGKIDPSLRTFHVNDCESLQIAAEEASKC